MERTRYNLRSSPCNETPKAEARGRPPLRSKAVQSHVNAITSTIDAIADETSENEDEDSLPGTPMTPPSAGIWDDDEGHYDALDTPITPPSPVLWKGEASGILKKPNASKSNESSKTKPKHLPESSPCPLKSKLWAKAYGIVSAEPPANLVTCASTAEEELGFEIKPQRLFRNRTSEDTGAPPNINHIGIRQKHIDDVLDLTFGESPRAKSVGIHAERSIRCISEDSERSTAGSTDEAFVEPSKKLPLILGSPKGEKKAVCFRNILPEILPLELYMRLQANSKMCVSVVKSSTKDPKERCSKTRRSSASVSDITKHLRRLGKYRDDRQFERFSKLLEGLIEDTMCGIHIRSAKGCIGRLLELVGEVHTKDDSFYALEESYPHDFRMLSNWVDGLCSPLLQPKKNVSAVIRTRAFHRKPNSMYSTVVSVQAILKFKTEQGGIRLLTELTALVYHTGDFEAYQPEWSRHWSTKSALKHEVEDELSKVRQCLPGQMYIFRDPHSLRYVKIGVTTQRPEKRLQQWADNCKKSFELDPFSYEPDLIDVPNVYRVEKLIHTELKEFRAKAYCTWCNQGHDEWFEIPLDLAKEVVRKWCRWMRTQPYEKCQYSNGETGWRLKETITQANLKAICKPVKPKQQFLDDWQLCQGKRSSTQRLTECTVTVATNLPNPIPTIQRQPRRSARLIALEDSSTSVPPESPPSAIAPAAHTNHSIPKNATTAKIKVRLPPTEFVNNTMRLTVRPK